ncbi:SAM-dependent methyltransferase [Profundibacterium mesophilum]|uniref:Ubiquinonemenaquinone biosynthesis methyltransferase n=1 Tax=Profundibacterium mesophilum KAUST100406-0324 TaxID=1037889 RepID=A0A921NRA3_9RHOB|nr:SAM-dependent methyltransferase [Profundibacterium mesophilum]KAF0676052.1 ubiquinonemenaquinone biosynthesis methyltransferase [Profundibacterium mesophilum KAUST100406-0324]
MPLPETLAHLEHLYAAEADPWGHLTRPYEAEKYAATLAAIGPGSFTSILEIGCGIGVLSARLAPLTGRLVSLDCVPAALEKAKARLGEQEHVQFICGPAPSAIPPGYGREIPQPQVVLLSEVLYFMTPEEIGELGAWIMRNAAPAARVVLVNWQGPTGEALGGAQAAALMRDALPRWHSDVERREGYDLEQLHAPAREA